MIFLRVQRNLYRINKFNYYQNKLSLDRSISFLSWWKNKSEENIENQSVSVNEEFYLPEPPNAPDIIENALEYNHLGEATFQSLGLNSMWPTGWVQSAFETFHVSLELPWWGTIALSAVCIRMVLSPLTVRLRKLNIAHGKATPIMADIEKKAKDAYLLNDYVSMSRLAKENKTFMDKNPVKPFQILILSSIQLPVFMSVMIGIRQMAQLPVSSLQSGGLLWFTDLTIPDPYYILPITTMILVWLQVEVGADFVSNSAVSSPYKKWGIRAIPVLGAIVTCNFPSALLLYWWCSSALSLSIVGAMKIPIIKKIFNVKDKELSSSSTVSSTPKQGFLKEWRKKSASNKIYDTAFKMESLNNERWIKAGTEVIPKTFSYDPTKITNKSS